MYQLFDRRRGVVTGTGRFHAWYHVIHSVWLPNFVLGVGPGLQGELLKAASGIAMAHNGILMNLAETGLVGTIPLLVILAASFRSCIRRRRNRNVHFAIALFAAGFLESLAENMMFSMGNPGSLLFLLSIAVLCMPEREAVAFAPPVDAAPADEAQWQTVGW
jgi:O-antigen ligase